MSNDNANGSPGEISFSLMCKERAEWPFSLGMIVRAPHNIMPAVRRDDAIFTYRLDVIKYERVPIPQFWVIFSSSVIPAEARLVTAHRITLAHG